MLTALRIGGFKAIFGASVPLGPFSLFIGRNGTGKSSAVEALQWLRDATFLGIDAATSGYGRFSALLNRRSRMIDFDLRFEAERAEAVHYMLHVAPSTAPLGRGIVDYERCVVGRTTAARAVLHSRKGQRGPAFRWVQGQGRPVTVFEGNELALRLARTLGGKHSGLPRFVDFLSNTVILRLSPGAIAAPSRHETKSWRPLLADDGHDVAALLLGMPQASRARVVKRLHEIFPHVEGISVAAIAGEQRFAVKERMRSRGGTRAYDIPSSLLSEGMRRLIAMFALLETTPKPSLLVIEEIENGLDPWTLQHVLDALRKASSETQIMLTSHSPFLLDHVHAVEVIHVKREQGETTYERVSEIQEAARYERVLAPGAMYLAEVFGSKAADGDE